MRKLERYQTTPPMTLAFEGPRTMTSFYESLMEYQLESAEVKNYNPRNWPPTDNSSRPTRKNRGKADHLP